MRLIIYTILLFLLACEKPKNEPQGPLTATYEVKSTCDPQTWWMFYFKDTVLTGQLDFQNQTVFDTTFKPKIDTLRVHATGCCKSDLCTLITNIYYRKELVVTDTLIEHVPQTGINYPL